MPSRRNACHITLLEYPMAKSAWPTLPVHCKEYKRGNFNFYVALKGMLEGNVEGKTTFGVLTAIKHVEATLKWIGRFTWNVNCRSYFEMNRKAEKNWLLDSHKPIWGWLPRRERVLSSSTKVIPTVSTTTACNVECEKCNIISKDYFLMLFYWKFAIRSCSHSTNCIHEFSYNQNLLFLLLYF